MMMFNGLMMRGDSDTSDLTKESGGASSDAEAAGGAGAGAGWDAAARAHYYYNKLISTLQVLQNKEETVRVQSESLRVAEARIAALGARAARLRAELDDKTHELHSLRRADKIGAQRADVSVATEAQELHSQKQVVRSLQTNQAIIEDLYRECFYETAKQEELIETLRKSYLEARETHTPSYQPPGREPSSDRDQDIAMEVDSLKLEITNFLNSSNNDSGVWGEELDVAAELRPISAQLRRLQALLAGDCTCGLLEENIKLKNDNEAMETLIGELRQRVSEQETALNEKENDEPYKIELEEKAKELHSVRQKLLQVEEGINEKNSACESFSRQLQQSQVSINDQARELEEMRTRCAAHEAAARQLQAALDRATQQAEESQLMCESLSRQAAAAAAVEARAGLQAARRRCHDLDETFRERARCAVLLQAQLEEAHARGAALCREVRAVVAAVHAWLPAHRARENKIKEQESLIKSLEYELEVMRKEAVGTKRDDSSYCVTCASQRPSLGSDAPSCSRWGRAGGGGREPAAPTPPCRLLRKKGPPCSAVCVVRREADACARRAYRRDAHTHCADPGSADPRPASPSSELEQRVTALRVALDHSQPRWARR